MSGVRVGSRLEQLLELRRKVDLEIEAERRNTPTPITRPRSSTTSSPWDGIPEHVTSRQIKEWAIRQGLLERARRGRAPKHLVDAYRKAHQ